MTREPHPRYDELEQFVLHSPFLSAARQKEIAWHIHDCERCADRRTQIAEFHEAHGALQPSPLSSRARRLLEALRLRNAKSPARMIEMHPLLRKSRIPGKKPDAVALAARDTNADSRYVTVCTLISEDESTILHLLRDNGPGRHILQVHADNETDYLHALVTFDHLAGDYITDASGEAIIPFEAIQEPHRLHASIRPVTSIFSILPQHLEMLARLRRISLTNAAGGLLRISQEGDAIRIEPAEDLRGEAPVRTLACIRESGGLVLRYEGDAALIPAGSFTGSRAIALY